MIKAFCSDSVILSGLSFVFFLLGISCTSNEVPINLPTYIYSTDAGQDILKIDPRRQTEQLIFSDQENMTWNSGGPLYIPDNRLMVTGYYYKISNQTAVIDLDKQENIVKLKLHYPMYFPKYSKFSFLMNGGVYVTDDIYDESKYIHIEDDGQSYYPYLAKMTDNEFGFFGVGTDGKKIYSVYNFETGKIRMVPALSGYSISTVYRSKTKEFFANDCSDGECEFFMINESGERSYVPSCIEELSYFHTVLHYDPYADQVYFLSGRAMFGLFGIMGETTDLYLYDYKTDKCVLVYKDIRSTGIVTSNEVAAIEGQNGVRTGH